MEIPEITFTIKDHDAIQSTAQAMEELKRMYAEGKKDTDTKFIDVEKRLVTLEKSNQEYHDYITTANSERKTWSVIGGAIGGVVMTAVSGLVLHLIGKI